MRGLSLGLPSVALPPAVKRHGPVALLATLVLGALAATFVERQNLRYHHARFYEGTRRYPMALKAYERLLEAQPDSPRAAELHVRAGEIYAAKFQRCVEARRHFEAAGRLEPPEPWALRARAGIMNCPDYFPLDAGRTWVYGDTQSGGKFMRLEWELRETGGGARGTVLSSMYAGDRRLKVERFSYEKRDWMVMEVGADGKGGPFLRFPFRAGESWTSTRGGETLRYQIEAENQTVTTVAGTFENCLKVRELNPRIPGSWKFDYYAPFVGRVKTTVGGPGFENPNTELIKYTAGS